MSYKALKKLLIWERKQKKVGCPLPSATIMAEIEEIETVPSVLLPCSSCNRTFRPEALAKHARVCEKSLMRKRKKFDSAKQRIAGTDLAQFVSTQSQLNLRRKPLSPKEEEQVRRKFSIPKDTTRTKQASSRWKEKHEDLVATIRRSRSGETTVMKKPSDHEQCQHCERFFGPKSYDRHVEWCKEQQLKAKAKGDVRAKERLQARTKYQAPLFKSQRTLTKEKFSPTKHQERSPPSPSNLNKDESVYKTVGSSGSSSPPNSKPISVDRSSPARNGNLRLKSPVIPRKSLSRRSPGEAAGETEAEPSRFCHECGGRYPVPSAKFCCLCGVRRLAIA